MLIQGASSNKGKIVHMWTFCLNDVLKKSRLYIAENDQTKGSKERKNQHIMKVTYRRNVETIVHELFQN